MRRLAAPIATIPSYGLRNPQVRQQRCPCRAAAVRRHKHAIYRTNSRAAAELVAIGTAVAMSRSQHAIANDAIAHRPNTR